MNLKEESEYDPHKEYASKYFIKEVEELLSKNNGSEYPITVQFISGEGYKTKWMSVSEEDIELWLDNL